VILRPGFARSKHGKRSLGVTGVGLARRLGEPSFGAGYALAPLLLEDDGGAWRPDGPGLPDSTLTTSNCLFT
jgi:hypothetical protein